ncbi:hypothetical protein ABZ953_30545 [Streptomyces sp. NPDC046465]|uniref:PRC-barrel domain-containing protein n=1 Tax=Streptomyces sp. NPDC046465 TaxID=3155810 RepID=UPI0033FDB1FC
MMLLSQTVGRPVVSASDAAHIGTVAGLVVDPEGPEGALITAVRLEGVKDGGDVIAWADVHAVGPDAVVVGAPTAARFTSADSSESQNLLGKRLLTELGDTIGTLADVAFDPGSGRIDTLHGSRGDRIAGARLLGVGSYAVVIRAATPDGG